ncbi:MAG: magnesium transporter CorA family protein [Hyphomicrobiales bacterium]|nr:magnesium transporter CorA family protein [Hyphomicrobiales bacterium]OQW83636.1 MAG: hypothetical protein BVN31_05375 [Proteobacteria bacterium ST_bin15]
MLRAYLHEQHNIVIAGDHQLDALPGNVVWMDLVEPTELDERQVEHCLGINVPTREEMQEIEVSSRLYTEDGAVFMTAAIISHADTGNPIISPITFVLAGERLITVRYTKPRAFDTFAQKLVRHNNHDSAGPLIFAGLIEAIIDRLADILESVNVDMDKLSMEIFDADPERAAGRNFQEILRRIGKRGDFATKSRESLVSLARIAHYFNETVDLLHLPYGRDMKNRMAAIDKDIGSLLDHTNYISGQVSFLLNASLGLINIEQNAIIKLFSVVSVVLMPPTLIASIYGMNFKGIPELDWPFGYPMALCMMAISAALPIWFFKRKRWF